MRYSEENDDEEDDGEEECGEEEEDDDDDDDEDEESEDKDSEDDDEDEEAKKDKDEAKAAKVDKSLMAPKGEGYIDLDYDKKKLLTTEISGRETAGRAAAVEALIAAGSNVAALNVSGRARVGAVESELGVFRISGVSFVHPPGLHPQSPPRYPCLYFQLVSCFPIQPLAFLATVDFSFGAWPWAALAVVCNHFLRSGCELRQLVST
jgi:hypothetical protein